MPSYTFVSTANSFVLRGAKPTFVDIRPDTMNIDETLIEEAKIVCEKGNNRSNSFRGEIDKYTWVSALLNLPAELNAAYFYAQFEKAASAAVVLQYKSFWDRFYHREDSGVFCKVIFILYRF